VLARLEPAVPRAAVTGIEARRPAIDGEDDVGGEAEPAGGRLVGRLVHRLLARFAPGGTHDPAIVRLAADALVTDEERASVPNLVAALDRAVAVHARLIARADLVDLFAGAAVAFEVPVSFGEGARVLRGTIDCLVRRPDGTLVVVEVKTGSPRPEHQAQLEAYLTAIRGLGPAIRATGYLVHP
jgi:RecB family exonuclease